MNGFDRRWLAAIVLALLAVPELAVAQTDEIQVYDAAIAAQGVFNLTWHNNFTPNGVTTPSFPGAVTANKSWNGVPEWAYGVTKWFELGLYMPLYSRDEKLGWGLDGFKIRTLFVSPHADDRTMFYGANFEFSFNENRWDTSRHTAEVRPIIGWHLKPVDIIINPIFDTAYDGFKNLEFVPAMRVAYNLSARWAVAAEEYDDFGPIHQFNPGPMQVHEIWGVVDQSGKALNVEVGVGFGLTEASDHVTLKLILSRDLNAKK